MALSGTRVLVIAATVLGGTLAGFALDKTVVQLPAWRQVGTMAWAEFTRKADLGRGLIVYPLQGMAALLCCVAAAIAFRLDRSAPSAAAVPIYLAAVLAIAALLVTTTIVAPDVLRLRHLPDNAAPVRQVFAHTQRWWAVKSALHLLTFCANIWSLLALGARVAP